MPCLLDLVRSPEPLSKRMVRLENQHSCVHNHSKLSRNNKSWVLVVTFSTNENEGILLQILATFESIVLIQSITRGSRIFDRTGVFRCTRSPSLLDPVLHARPCLGNLVLDHAHAHLRVGHARLPEAGHALLRPQVGVGQDGVPRLVLPDQIANVLHGEGQNGVGGANTDGCGDGCAEQDVAVSGDDAASHARNQDVQGTGEDSLARLFGRGQGADGGGERVLETEGFGEGVVHAILGADGLLVQSETRFADLDSKTVGRRRAVGSIRRGCRWRSGCDGFCGSWRGRVQRRVVVDGFPVQLQGVSERAGGRQDRNAYGGISERLVGGLRVHLGKRNGRGGDGDTGPDGRKALAGGSARARKGAAEGHSPAGAAVGRPLGMRVGRNGWPFVDAGRVVVSTDGGPAPGFVGPLQKTSESPSAAL